jgi:ATP/ADP translocase
MTAAFVLVKTGRDALYFQGRGLFDLPMAYLGIAALSLPSAVAILAAMRGLGPRAARVIVPLAVALSLGAFYPLARPGGGPTMTVFFMLVPVLFSGLFSLTWLLAADLLDGVPRARLAGLYSVVGAASILGGVLGGLVAKTIAPHVEPAAFIAIGSATLVVCAAIVGLVQRVYPAHQPTAPGEGSPLRVAVVRDVLRARYTFLLLATGMTASLVGILIEFQFYIAAAVSGNTGRENAGFFANVYLVLNAVAFAVQLGVMPRLQRLAGVHGSLLVLPGALLAGATALVAGASMGVRSLVRVAEGGLKSSIHRSNWEQAYLPLGRTHRVVAKLLVDGAGARIAEGIAATALFVWLHVIVSGSSLVGHDPRWLGYALVATSIVWILLTRALGRSLARAERAADPSEPFRPEVPLPDT